jgi:LysM repeat protein
VRRLTCSTLLLVLTLAAPASAEVAHTVQPGETLWSIAVSTYPGDPREGVWKLEQRNGLAGPTIVPGQRLLLP